MKRDVINKINDVFFGREWAHRVVRRHPFDRKPLVEHEISSTSPLSLARGEMFYLEKSDLCSTIGTRSTSARAR